jgi:predicted phosphoribosyltransferase
MWEGDLCRPPLHVRPITWSFPFCCTVILVDDGIATGSCILAAIAAVRRQGAARIVVAIPVAPAVSV